jgi:hypothetical protein
LLEGCGVKQLEANSGIFGDYTTRCQMPSANVPRLLMRIEKLFATLRTWVRTVYTSSAAYQVPYIKVQTKGSRPAHLEWSAHP